MSLVHSTFLRSGLVSFIPHPHGWLAYGLRAPTLPGTAAGNALKRKHADGGRLSELLEVLIGTGVWRTVVAKAFVVATWFQSRCGLARFLLARSRWQQRPRRCACSRPACAEELRPTMAQRLSAAACADGLSDPHLVELAALGACGQFPANIERDYHRRQRHKDMLKLEPDAVTLPLLDRRSRCPKPTPVWVFSPIDVLLTIQSRGLGPPRHANTWGGFCKHHGGNCICQQPRRSQQR